MPGCHRRLEILGTGTDLVMQNKIQKSFFYTFFQTNSPEKKIGSGCGENLRNTEVGYLCETAIANGVAKDLTAHLFYNCYKQGANIAVPRRSRFVYFQPQRSTIGSSMPRHQGCLCKRPSLLAAFQAPGVWSTRATRIASRCFNSLWCGRFCHMLLLSYVLQLFAS